MWSVRHCARRKSHERIPWWEMRFGREGNALCNMRKVSRTGTQARRGRRMRPSALQADNTGQASGRDRHARHTALPSKKKVSIGKKERNTPTKVEGKTQGGMPWPTPLVDDPFIEIRDEALEKRIAAPVQSATARSGKWHFCPLRIAPRAPTCVC